MAVDDRRFERKIMELIRRQQIETGVTVSLVAFFAGRDFKAACPLAVLFPYFGVFLVNPAGDRTGYLDFKGWLILQSDIPENDPAVI
jgi:hypothetical protein